MWCKRLKIFDVVALLGVLVVSACLSTPAMAQSGQFALVRYNATGTLDTTFGNGGSGRVLTSFPGATSASANALARDAAGNLVAAGTASVGNGCQFAFARYFSNGNLDGTFGSGGRVLTDFPSSTCESTNALARDAAGNFLDPAGRFVAAGFAHVYNAWNFFALARYYNSNGSLDLTFGPWYVPAGTVRTSFPGATDVAATAVARDAASKLVVAGYASTSTGKQCALARYNADGSLDATFGGSNGTGRLLTSFPNTNGVQAHALVLVGGGKLVVAGGAFGNTGGWFALARYNANGTLDATFGNNGRVLTDFPNAGSPNARALVLVGGGKLVVAGGAFGNTGGWFALARYNANGTLDATFGNNGRVLTDFPNAVLPQGYALALDAEGRLVVAGSAVVTIDGRNRRQIALARYNANGTLDAAFGNNGRVLSSFPTDTSATALVLDAQGRLVVAGTAQ